MHTRTLLPLLLAFALAPLGLALPAQTRAAREVGGHEGHEGHEGHNSLHPASTSQTEFAHKRDGLGHPPGTHAPFHAHPARSAQFRSDEYWAAQERDRLERERFAEESERAYLESLPPEERALREQLREYVRELEEEERRRNGFAPKEERRGEASQGEGEGEGEGRGQGVSDEDAMKDWLREHALGRVLRREVGVGYVRRDAEKDVHTQHGDDGDEKRATIDGVSPEEWKESHGDGKRDAEGRGEGEEDNGNDVHTQDLHVRRAYTSCLEHPTEEERAECTQALESETAARYNNGNWFCRAGWRGYPACLENNEEDEGGDEGGDEGACT